MELALLISGLVFVGMLILMVGGYALFQSRKRAKEWGERVKGKVKTQEDMKQEAGVGYLKSQLLQLLEKLGQANKPKDQAETSRLRKSLVTAGYRSPRAPIVFLGTKIFLMIFGVGMFFLFGAEMTKDKPMSYFIGGLVGSAMVGFYAPQFWLSQAMDKRKERIIDGFPDALDLMVVCVEAGLGLDQAIARVGEEISIGHKDLGDEFKILSLELRAGLTREQALRNLNDRTDVEEIRSLVALLIQTDRFGTSIGQALRVHSDSMRMNRRLKAEEMAAKLPVKLMGPLILCIFPALLIVIMGPGVILLMKKVFPAMGGGG
ncbi:MAG: type II secretion system F family protein [Nitrospirales bacterium]|nr:type II secretion system F family protein [Nitrospira sp.]MDR4501788.1 type II secretion system F family protein [Nitrospirales bacterium]